MSEQQFQITVNTISLELIIEAINDLYLKSVRKAQRKKEPRNIKAVKELGEIQVLLQNLMTTKKYAETIDSVGHAALDRKEDEATTIT